jgi:hypothetical protein
VAPSPSRPAAVIWQIYCLPLLPVYGAIPWQNDLAIRYGIPVSSYGTFTPDSYVKRAGNVISLYVDFTATKTYTAWSDKLFQLPDGFHDDTKYTLMTVAIPVSNSSERARACALREGYRFQLNKDVAVGERIAFRITVIL